MATMDRWTTDFKSISTLQLEHNVPIPSSSTLLPTQVLVRIHAVSLNYRDIEVISGLYTHHKGMTASGAGSDSSSEPRLVPCSDFGGEIVGVGAGVKRLSEGDRVMSVFNTEHVAGEITQELLRESGLGLPLEGVLQSYRTFEEKSLLRLPDGYTYAQGSTLPIAAGTAWTALYGLQPLKPGQTVLILGTGGVSIFALQIASLAGALTIITSSSPTKLALAKSLGATRTINYTTTPDWDAEVLRLTDGRGADQVIEVGGQDTLVRSFGAVRFGGLINAIGYLGGKGISEDEVGIAVLAIRRHVTYKGILIGPRTELEDMVRFIEAKGLKPVIDKEFAFSEAKEAFEYVKAQKHVGKVVIRVTDEE